MLARRGGKPQCNHAEGNGYIKGAFASTHGKPQHQVASSEHLGIYPAELVPHDESKRPLRRRKPRMPVHGPFGFKGNQAKTLFLQLLHHGKCVGMVGPGDHALSP